MPRDSFDVLELAVTRMGDVNRHAYTDAAAIRALVHGLRPDVLDIHEEPFSVASRQWLAATPTKLPVVMYTAQNVAKRYPPPFAQYERSALRRVAALYPCSRQAASVARGKGFAGLVEVLPLGYDDALFFPGTQSLEDDELVLGLFGRLVPEKGATDAVRVLARLHVVRPTRLVVVGRGPDEGPAHKLAVELGVADRIELLPWQSAAELASTYRRVHVALVPSRPTETWVEQFGRVIVEAQASGAVVAGYASGAIPEVAGDAAVLARLGDVDGLAQLVADLVADRSAFNRRRALGLALSRTRTWAQVAERQAALYRRVALTDAPQVQQAWSPRKRRAAAHREFGPPSETTAGARPFALPLLRRGGRVPKLLAAVLDGAAELTGWLRERQAKH